MISTATMFAQGFIVKVFTGVDNTLANTPLLASVTKTREGKISFCCGMFTALLVLLGVSAFFAAWFAQFTNAHWIAAGLLIVLAMLVYTDTFVHKPRKACCKLIECRLRCARTESALPRIGKMLLAGFLAFIAVGVDEVVAYSSIMINPATSRWIVASGIIAAGIVELVIIYNFSRWAMRLPHKEKITSVALVALAALVGWQVI